MEYDLDLTYITPNLIGELFSLCFSFFLLFSFFFLFACLLFGLFDEVVAMSIPAKGLEATFRRAQSGYLHSLESLA